jgi:PAS domain S-box-containing protein
VRDRRRDVQLISREADRPEIILDLPVRGPVELREWAGRQGLQSLVSAPLVRGRQHIGCLELFFRQPVGLAVAECIRAWGSRISRLVERHAAGEHQAMASDLAATLLRWTPAAVIGLGPGGDVTLWSAAAERMLGWRSDEALCRPLRIVPPPGRGEFERRLQQVLQGCRSDCSDTVRLRSDGATVSMRSTLVPCRSSSGRITGALEILVDLTDRRRTEAQRRALLRVQEIAAGAQQVADAGPAFLQTMCELGGWVRAELWIVDPDSRGIRCSSEWSRHGHAGRDRAAHVASLLLPPGSGLPGLVWQQRKAAYLPVLPTSGETLRAIPNSLLHTGGYGVPVMHRQRLLGVIAVFDPALTEPDAELSQTLVSIAHVVGQFLALQRCETELADAQAKLRQSQKMDAIGLLTGGIAHDFNNVLTVILSYSELAGEEIDPDHPAHEMLAEIFNAGQRAASMTRRLLTFSRRQDEQPVLINPNEMVADIERMLRRLITPNVILETSLAESIGPIRADPGQLEQVLVNFVVNARDAMPDGGRITISTHELTLRTADARRHPAAHSGDYVGIAVTDTGCGMDEATRQRIFEPFFTTKAPGRGTGMGLATVAAIVKQCGGFIEVDTAPGRGTSMQVFLPRAHETLATLMVDAVPVTCPTGNETIIVVEEDVTIRTLVRRIIQVRGYHVLEAADGADALRVVRASSEPVSLVLTSPIVADMPGHELARRLHMLSPVTRVIFLVDCTDDRPAGAADGAQTVVQKPFTSDGLARTIRAVLDKRAEG